MAIDKDTAKLLPFQELSRRKRKDVKVEDIKVRVCLFAFDLLYLNGEVRFVSLIGNFIPYADPGLVRPRSALLYPTCWTVFMARDQLTYSCRHPIATTPEGLH